MAGKRDHAHSDPIGGVDFNGFHWIITGWWFGICVFLPYIGINNPNWLIFVKGSNHQPDNG